MDSILQFVHVLKLRSFGVAIDGPAKILCDNQSVVTNSQKPESTLSKKHLSVIFHRVREAVSRKVISVGKIFTKMNLADLFTKTTIPTEERKHLMSGIVCFNKKRLRDIEDGDTRLNPSIPR